LAFSAPEYTEYASSEPVPEATSSDATGECHLVSCIAAYADDLGRQLVGHAESGGFPLYST